MKLIHIEWHFPSACGPIDINTIIIGKIRLRKVQLQLHSCWVLIIDN